MLTAVSVADAFPDDGIGKRIVPSAAVALPGNDEAGDGIGVPPGNPTITVGAPSTIGTLQTIGDQDFYAIHLNAGVLYQIGLYGTASGPNGVALADAYIEIYDSNGNRIDAADGGGETPGGQLYGLDALLTIEVLTSGTYYINARAFEMDGSNGDTGDGVGDYELFARISTYDPYYSTFSPLYSLDWGTQVNKMHQSVRNPDGNEGPRSTGNPPGTTNYSDATALQALATAQGKGDITGKNVITVYFAKAGEVYHDQDPTTPGTTDTMISKGFEAWEIAAYKYAFAAYEKVADIIYLVVDNVYDPITQTAAADFTFIIYEGTSGAVGPSLLGRMSPPDEDNEGQSEFNGNDIRWTPQGVAPGGFSFNTLIHEMGHGHGLAHPHDNGGRSGIMRGVEPEGVAFDYTTGDYDLNQGVYTMMSYEDGWQKSPYGQARTTDPFGWVKGLMAFDIAAIQDKYGVNEDTATGDNVYVLEDTNHGTTFDANHNIVQFASGFESIWDAGGIDSITYVGNRDVTIDLRPATLRYEYGGGGWVSYATGVYGGFTIANGVTIENARSGNGNDKLTGNAANNILDSGAGNDSLYLWFGGGDDTALGGGGNDNFFFGATLTPADIVTGGADFDTLVVQGNYGGGLTLSANVTGIEAFSILAGSNTNFGETGAGRYDYVITTHDANFAPGVQAKVNGSALLGDEDFTFNGSAETDASFVVYGGKGRDTLTGGSGSDIFFFDVDRFFAGDTVNGGPGYDGMFLRGNYGIDFNAPGYAGLLTSIDNITVTSASDLRYARGGGSEFDYHLILSDAMTGAGQTLTVSGALLQSNESLIVNGSRETDGNLRLFGGAAHDELTGGGGNDLIQGGLAADTLAGGGGADTFLYRSTAESGRDTIDRILDFTPGTDKIDLSGIDANTLAAGDQAFSWIGSNAFTGAGAASAGELRFYELLGSIWVEGDTNGDGVADMIIALNTPGVTPVAQSDFML
ncbi:MAG TPA: M10 family metallopeptidase C-terminal domain-containing protein [Allosphingosinicella sp.]|nr:M10 family metallopeptidase C-terminal domain-containing protein [Allosphingosinicella sp.]